MSTKRQVLGVFRHGDTPVDADGLSLDSLTDASVQNMYEESQLYMDSRAGRGTKTDKTFVLHSDKDRTVTTAQTRLAGMRDLGPKPSTQEDLAGFDFNGVLFSEIKMLSYADLVMNMEAVNEMGLSKYCQWMLDNRESSEMDGKPITSFQQIYDTRRPVLREAVELMKDKNYDLGFVSTHGLMSDAITMAAVDSARATPATSYDDIGGQFEKEGVAYLIIDTDLKSGKTEAKVHRGDLELPVNLDTIMNY